MFPTPLLGRSSWIADVRVEREPHRDWEIALSPSACCSRTANRIVSQTGNQPCAAVCARAAQQKKKAVVACTCTEAFTGCSALLRNATMAELNRLVRFLD